MREPKERPCGLRDDEVAHWRRRAEEAERLLGNLLARIHRDGGHHQEEVRTAQACKDAERIVADLIVREEVEAL